MDVCNGICLAAYFKLIKMERGRRVNVLALYRCKTVIFLGNIFVFYGLEWMSAVDLCDSGMLFEACPAGTSCLFLGAVSEHERFKDLLFPVSQIISEILLAVAMTSSFEGASC